MTTANDIVLGQGHSYRNFNPLEIAEIVENDDLTLHEQQQELQQVLSFIESARLRDFCERTFAFFIKLDRDEKELFTRRNPDLMQWVSVWGLSQEATDPLTEWREMATDYLAEDRSEATNPPDFPSVDTRDYDSLLQDMMHRRRSYRNWAPVEFERIMEPAETDLPKGRTRELGIYKPGFVDEIDEEAWPIEVDSKDVARSLLDRVEDGRFEPALAKGRKFFGPLDVDERRMFAARNPGIIRWISVYNESNHLIHGEEQLKVEFEV